MENKENVISTKSIAFALRIIEYAELLADNGKHILSCQILRAGTSIGANIHEAQSPESRKDFIHKLKIADKEAFELEYWLELCDKSASYPHPDNLIEELAEIKALLRRCIITAKKNLDNGKSSK